LEVKDRDGKMVYAHDYDNPQDCIADVKKAIDELTVSGWEGNILDEYPDYASIEDNAHVQKLMVGVLNGEAAHSIFTVLLTESIGLAETAFINAFAVRSREISPYSEPGTLIEYAGHMYVVVQEQSAGIIALPSGYQDNIGDRVTIYDKENVRVINQ
jgi:hypothetical protein